RDRMTLGIRLADGDLPMYRFRRGPAVGKEKEYTEADREDERLALLPRLAAKQPGGSPFDRIWPAAAVIERTYHGHQREEPSAHIRGKAVGLRYWDASVR